MSAVLLIRRCGQFHPIILHTALHNIPIAACKILMLLIGQDSTNTTPIYHASVNHGRPLTTSLITEACHT